MNKSYVIAAAIATVAVLWVASGVVFSTNTETELSAIEQAANNQPQGLQRVQVIESRAMPRVREIRVAGRTEASRQITLRSETEGTVDELLVTRGTTVTRGQPLVRLGLNDRQAKLSKAEALVSKRELEFRAAEDLSKKSFTSEVSLANARAELESARAELEGAKLEISRTVIRAPFDGVFNRNHVEIGDYVRLGDEIAEMVDLDPILVIAELAELAVSDVSVGAAATADLINGQVVEGPITFVSSLASPETRTFSVEVSVKNPDGRLIDGMTATLRLPAQQEMAHSIPPAALTLDDSGAVGVKLVDRQGIVSFAEASTSSASSDSVWLSGLPPSVSIITVGQEFVTVGQKVEPVITNNGELGPVGLLPNQDVTASQLVHNRGIKQ